MNRANTLARPRLPIGASLLLALALTYFSCFFAFSEVILCRYIAVLVFVLLLFTVVRSKLVTILCALPCLLAFIGAESSALIPMLLCAVAVIGFGGFVIHTARLPIVIAIPVLSFGLVYFVTGDPVQALLVLLPIPAAIASALAMRYKLTRTGAVAAVAVVLCVITVILLYMTLVPSGTQLTKELIEQTVTQISDPIGEVLFESYESMGMFEDESGINAEDVRNALKYTSKMLLPAILIVAAELIAYLGCLITVTLRGSLFPDHPLPKKCLGFRMSAVSAVLFLLSFLLFLLLLGNSNGAGIALITALNLFVILQPGLAVCGLLSLLATFRRRGGCFPVLILVMSLWFFSLIPTVLAFVGAIAVLRTERRNAKDRE